MENACAGGPVLSSGRGPSWGQSLFRPWREETAQEGPSQATAAGRKTAEAAGPQPRPLGAGRWGGAPLGAGGTDPCILGQGHNAQNLGRQCGDIPALKGHMAASGKNKTKT